MTDHCAYPKCGKELTHIEGRKKKKYCNQNCNTRHWQMMNPAYKPKTKRVPIEQYQNLIANIDPKAGDIQEANKALHEGVLNSLPKTITKRVYPLVEKDMIPRLEGESSLDYRIRCEELRIKK